MTASPSEGLGSRPSVLVLQAPGTNRDHAAARACEHAGGRPEGVLLSALLDGRVCLDSFDMLVLPGGFSHGDDMGAGRIWAARLRARLGVQLDAFVASGRPVLGICNGFQALVQLGLLPGETPRPVTLTHNQRAQFECRWVTLEPDPDSPCVFTQGVGPIDCPVAHGEGRIVFSTPSDADRFVTSGLAPLRYRPTPGTPDGYPGNPNGSKHHIAGLCSPSGTVFGLMPHPEDHIFDTQHPQYHRGLAVQSGLPLFEAGIRHAAAL